MTTHRRPTHPVPVLSLLAALVAGPFAGSPAAVGPPGQPAAPPVPAPAWDDVVWGQNIVWGNCAPDEANIVWGNATGRGEPWLDAIQADLEALADACGIQMDVPDAGAPASGAAAPPPAPAGQAGGR